MSTRDEMRATITDPLVRMAFDVRTDVIADAKRHKTCIETVYNTSRGLLDRVAPTRGGVYARIGNELLTVEPITLQIHTMVTSVYHKHYKLAPEVTPAPVRLLAALKKEQAYLLYLNDADQDVFPPFHVMLSEVAKPWWNVCLGQEREVNLDTLARLLTVVDFSNSFAQLISLPEATRKAHPFDKWIAAWPKLERGEPVDGFTPIVEMTI